jgi:hypothetical protein
VNKVIAGITAGLVLALSAGTMARATSEDIDSNGDNIIDVILIDRWEDGVADVYAQDLDQNGVLEGYLLDADNNGVIDTYGYDWNQNGIIEIAMIVTTTDAYGQLIPDAIFRDADENGVEDSQQLATASYPIFDGIVGPVTSPDGFYSLMTSMAGITGQATFGTSDSDGDGWHDNQDFYPDDPYRH